MKILRTIILTVLLTTFLSVPALAQSRIATVDLGKLINGYWKTKQASDALKQSQTQAYKDIKDMQDNLTKVNADYQQLLEQANDQALSADERTKRQQAADDKLKEYQRTQAALNEMETATDTRLHQQQQQMIAGVLKDIQAAVKTKAQAAGYAIVVDSTAVSGNGFPVMLYNSGENDLTAAVLAQLNAGAPVIPPPVSASMDTNSP